MHTLLAQFPYYRLSLDGFEFTVVCKFTSDGCLYFDPVIGWDNLTVITQKHPENLLDMIDDCIYNATPDVYEHFDVKNDDKFTEV